MQRSSRQLKQLLEAEPQRLADLLSGASQKIVSGSLAPSLQHAAIRQLAGNGALLAPRLFSTLASRGARVARMPRGSAAKLLTREAKQVSFELETMSCRLPGACPLQQALPSQAS
jgi:hypothetical protein